MGTQEALLMLDWPHVLPFKPKGLAMFQKFATAPSSASAQISETDSFIAKAWGITSEGWQLLTHEERISYRLRVSRAPYLHTSAS